MVEGARFGEWSEQDRESIAGSARVLVALLVVIDMAWTFALVDGLVPGVSMGEDTESSGGGAGAAGACCGAVILAIIVFAIVLAVLTANRWKWGPLTACASCWMVAQILTVGGLFTPPPPQFLFPLPAAITVTVPFTLLSSRHGPIKFPSSTKAPGTGRLISIYAGVVLFTAGLTGTFWYAMDMLLGAFRSPLDLVLDPLMTTSLFRVGDVVILLFYDIFLTAQMLALLFFASYLCMHGGPWRTGVLASGIATLWYLALLVEDLVQTGNINYYGDVPIAALVLAGFIIVAVSSKGMDRPFPPGILRWLGFRRY